MMTPHHAMTSGHACFETNGSQKYCSNSLKGFSSEGGGGGEQIHLAGLFQ